MCDHTRLQWGCNDCRSKAVTYDSDVVWYCARLHKVTGTLQRLVDSTNDIPDNIGATIYDLLDELDSIERGIKRTY